MMCWRSLFEWKGTGRGPRNSNEMNASDNALNTIWDPKFDPIRCEEGFQQVVKQLKVRDRRAERVCQEDRDKHLLAAAVNSYCRWWPRTEGFKVGLELKCSVPYALMAK